MANDQEQVVESKALSTEKAPAMPPALARRGIDESAWRALMNIFPGCASDSVLLVWDYCKARKLDPMKKPCHIVPMKVKVNGEYVWRDVVMPGIYEYRITAHRTGKYLGHSKPEYGPMKEHLGVSAPEWCDLTVWRESSSGKRIEFPVRIFFSEVVATKDEWKNKERTGKQAVNERWSRAPIQMLVKCAEAAALREAFPEEFGGEPTAEEMEGRHDAIDAEVVRTEAADPVREFLESYDEDGQIEKLLQAANLNAAKTVVLIKKFAGNPKGLIAELTPATVPIASVIADNASAQVEKAQKAGGPKPVVGKVINTPAEAKAAVASGDPNARTAAKVEAPSAGAVFDNERDSI